MIDLLAQAKTLFVEHELKKAEDRLRLSIWARSPKKLQAVSDPDSHSRYTWHWIGPNDFDLPRASCSPMAPISDTIIDCPPTDAAHRICKKCAEAQRYALHALGQEARKR